MDQRETIKDFSYNRPTASGVFGYGSGVFKQAQYTVDTKRMIDVIFVVDNMPLWHRENMSYNPNDYSFLGKMHLSTSATSKLKGCNNITYLSHVNFNNCVFKYGVIEVNDFLNSLGTWENIFIAGRFHKPVLEVETTEEMQDVISYNRKSALLVACLLSEKNTTVFKLYCTLCGLSYIGDARMTIAENPHKVENIVKGCYRELMRLYPLDQDYIKVSGDQVHINKKILLSHIYELPENLLEYLELHHTNFHDLDELKANIMSFLLSKNSLESKAQIVDGLKSNGIIKSTSYALSKIKKRFK